MVTVIEWCEPRSLDIKKGEMKQLDAVKANRPLDTTKTLCN